MPTTSATGDDEDRKSKVEGRDLGRSTLGLVLNSPFVISSGGCYGVTLCP